MGILRRLLGLQNKLSPSDDTQTPTTRANPGEVISPGENVQHAHNQARVATSVEKICALCGTTIEHGVIACPKCGRGLFESTKKARAPEPAVEGLGKTNRLSSILIVIERDSGEHQVLLDRILDRPTGKTSGNPRRFNIDLNTKCQIHISGYATKKITELLMYISFSYPMFVDLRNPDRMDSLSFKFDGISGQSIERWDDMEVKTSPLLRCNNCGKTYDLTRNAATATMEGALSGLLERGRYVIKVGSEDKTSDPDLVMSMPNSPSPANKLELNYVVSRLRGGQLRRWDCGACKHVQGYPGSFIRYAFPGIS